MRFLLSLVLSLPAVHAADSFPGEAWDQKLLTSALEAPAFIDPSIFQLVAPSPGVPEMPVLKKAAAARTPASMQLLQDELFEPTHHVLEVSTPSPESKPATLTLIFLARRDTNTVVTRQQVIFNRARPAMLDPYFLPAFAAPGCPSYPSRPATEAFVAALLLSRLDPARADQYQKRADEIIQRTEVAGVHFPSDGFVGKSLAHRITEALYQNPAFLRILDAAQSEWPVAQSPAPVPPSKSSPSFIDRLFKR